jgi:hypothetical protein
MQAGEGGRDVGGRYGRGSEVTGKKLHPEYMCGEAAALVESTGCRVRIWLEARVRERGYEGSSM